MASIKPYTNKKGTFYQAVIYCGTDMYGKPKQIKKKGFKTYREADRWATKTKAEANEKGADSFAKNLTTYGEVYELWKESYKESVSSATYELAIQRFEKHILPLTVNIAIEKMKLPFCQKLYNTWRESHANSASLTLSYCGRIFKYAIHLGIIKENPCINVIKAKKVQDDKEVYKMWTKEELNQFLDLCKQDKHPITYPLYRLMAYTGLRRGEVAALKWNDIDLDNQLLHVNRTITREGKKFVVGATTKTKKSKRIISLDDETTKIMKEYKKQALATAFKNKTKTIDNTLVFYEADAKRLTDNIYSLVQNRFETICKKYNLKKITLHGLRHTHCSLLLQSGANVKVVSERLGHKDINTTLNIYTHVTKEQDREIVNDLAEFLA